MKLTYMNEKSLVDEKINYTGCHLTVSPEIIDICFLCEKVFQTKIA